MKIAAWIFIFLASLVHMWVFLACNVIRFDFVFVLVLFFVGFSHPMPAQISQVNSESRTRRTKWTADGERWFAVQFWLYYRMQRLSISLVFSLFINFLFCFFFFICFPPQRSSFSKFDALQKQNLANVRTGEAAKLNVNVFISISLFCAITSTPLWI